MAQPPAQNQPINHGLDPTGVSPLNYILNESQALRSGQDTAVVPQYSPFFEAGLSITDSLGATVPASKYTLLNLVTEPTLKYGKAIYSMLAIDSTVSGPVQITYHALGGLYEVIDVKSLAELINTQGTTARPVSYKNILNPPSEFPPSGHSHPIGDVYGFEYLVTVIDRLRDAILLTDIPAFEEIVNWVKSRTADALPLEIALANKAPDVSNKDMLVTWDDFYSYLKAYCDCGGGKKWFNPNEGPIMERTFSTISVSYPNAASNINYKCVIKMRGDDVLTDFFPTGSETIPLDPFNNIFVAKFIVSPVATVNINPDTPPMFSISLVDEYGAELEKSGIYHIVAYADYIGREDYDPYHYKRICCIYQPRIPITSATLYMLEHARILRGGYISPTAAKPLSVEYGGTGGNTIQDLINSGRLYTTDDIDAANGLAGLDANGKLNPSILPIAPAPTAWGPVTAAGVMASTGVINKNTPYTFTITNFDSWTKYNVSSSLGTTSATLGVVNEVITYTPTVAGKHELIINGKHFLVGTVA